MRFFGYEITLTKVEAPEQRELDPGLESWLRGDTGTDGTPRGMTNAYAQVVWVYRAVNALAEAVASFNSFPVIPAKSPFLPLDVGRFQPKVIPSQTSPRWAMVCHE